MMVMMIVSFFSPFVSFWGNSFVLLFGSRSCIPVPCPFLSILSLRTHCSLLLPHSLTHHAPLSLEQLSLPFYFLCTLFLSLCTQHVTVPSLLSPLTLLQASFTTSLFHLFFSVLPRALNPLTFFSLPKGLSGSAPEAVRDVWFIICDVCSEYSELVHLQLTIRSP